MHHKFIDKNPENSLNSERKFRMRSKEKLSWICQDEQRSLSILNKVFVENLLHRQEIFSREFICIYICTFQNTEKNRKF